jgi:glycosyltransferase involved in cell wall biosynthesis
MSRDARRNAGAHVAHLIPGLGIGGNAKNLLSLAREQAAWARVSIVTTDPTGGAFARSLAPELELVSGVRTPADLSAWLGANLPACLFIHRGGEPSASEAALLRVCAGHGAAAFEYNTFARVDPETDALWTGHLQVSRAALVHYARRRGRSPLGMDDQLAAGYSVEAAASISAEERTEARARLRLPQNGIVAVRLMRPDLRKWDPTPVVGVRRSIHRGTPVHLVVREPPPQRVRWARRVLRDHLTTLPATADSGELRTTLAAADVLVNYSSIGEGFGLALAEGMACGLVPIVNATPKADNAQIELCENGVTGVVANGAQALADALAFLAAHPDVRSALGEAARQSILERFAAPVVERRIRRFVRSRLRANGNAAWSLVPDPGGADSYVLDHQWLARYQWAEGASFRTTPLSFIDAADALRLQVLRLGDAAKYAHAIGPRIAMGALALRLKHGSLRRL